MSNKATEGQLFASCYKNNLFYITYIPYHQSFRSTSVWICVFLYVLMLLFSHFVQMSAQTSELLFFVRFFIGALQAGLIKKMFEKMLQM